MSPPGRKKGLAAVPIEDGGAPRRLIRAHEGGNVVSLRPHPLRRPAEDSLPGIDYDSKDVQRGVAATLSEDSAGTGGRPTRDERLGSGPRRPPRIVVRPLAGKGPTPKERRDRAKLAASLPSPNLPAESLVEDELDTNALRARRDPHEAVTEEPGPPAAVPLWLAVVSGTESGRQVEVADGEILVGRGSSCELQITHPSVSRNHALFVRKGSDVTVRDLGSANGTFVNGRPAVNDLPVGPGDEILIGQVLVALRKAGEPKPKPVKMKLAPGELPKPLRWLRAGLVLAAACIVGAIAVVAVLRLTAEEPRPARPVPLKSVAAARKDAASPSPGAPTPATGPAAEPAPAPAPSPAPVAKAEPLPSPRATAAWMPGAPSRGGTTGPVRKKGGKTLPPPKSAIVEGTQSAIDAYRAGDVDGCIGQLEKVRPADKRTTALLARVQDFKGALAQGRADLAARDAAGAVGALERALRLDEQIGGGSGKLNGEIRTDLGKLHYLFALRWHDSGKDDKAKHELELAIDRDPSHQKAQKLLGELSAGTAAAPEEAPPGDDGN